jgi:hypothetical protein
MTKMICAASKAGRVPARQSDHVTLSIPEKGAVDRWIPSKKCGSRRTSDG